MNLYRCSIMAGSYVVHVFFMRADNHEHAVALARKNCTLRRGARLVIEATSDTGAL